MAKSTTELWKSSGGHPVKTGGKRSLSEKRVSVTKNRDPLRGHVPLPARGEQTETQKRLEGLLFAAINVAANEVPIVGSIFNEVRLYRANEVMERRLATLVEEFKEQMKTVKETTVDWEFVRSEPFST